MNNSLIGTGWVNSFDPSITATVTGVKKSKQGQGIISFFRSDMRGEVVIPDFLFYQNFEKIEHNTSEKRRKR